VKTADISDKEVVAACKDYHAALRDGVYGDMGLNLLMERTGAPVKVAYSAMLRAYRRGLINFGVSLRTAWPEEAGLALLEEK
jgi:hypothetical protein